MSTINRNVPGTNAPLTSDEVRANFGAAADDIDGLEAVASTGAQKAALDAANSPSGTNAIATLADVPPAQSGGGIAKGTPFTIGDVLEVQSDASDGIARSTDAVTRINRTDMATGSVAVAVVPVLPASPDANTLYVLTS